MLAVSDIFSVGVCLCYHLCHCLCLCLFKFSFLLFNSYRRQPSEYTGCPKKTHFQNHHCSPTIYPSPQAWLAGSKQPRGISLTCQLAGWWFWKCVFLGHPVYAYTGLKGEICHCHHCRRQCKILASGVNFSIFTHAFVLLSPKLLKFGKIKGVKVLAWKSGGVKFWTNLMSDWSVEPLNSVINHKTCKYSIRYSFSFFGTL